MFLDVLQTLSLLSITDRLSETKYKYGFVGDRVENQITAIGRERINYKGKIS